MFLLSIGIAFYAAGYIIFLLTSIFPILRIIYMDWIATILFVAPWAITIYRLQVTKSYKQADKLPTWKHLINYMRRDNNIVPIIGERAYPGESFIDVPKLGLIEFLGKDCVYNWGDKKVLWGLENINFTPDPRYSNLCHLLWELGFRSSDDVKNVLNGTDIYLMGEIYTKMLEYNGKHGVKKLITDMQNYEGKKIDFKPEVKKRIMINTDKIEDLIDKLPFRGNHK